MALVARGDDAEATRHDAVAGGARAVGHGEGAHEQPPRLQRARLPQRRRRERLAVLRDVERGGRDEPRAQLGERRRVERAAEDRLGAPHGERRLDDHLAQLREHVREHARLAAPPGLDARQRELLAEQRAAHARQERHERRRLHDARAERVRDGDVALAHGLQQPGHAQRRVGAQLERVAEVVVEPAQDDVDAVQAAQRLQVDAALAHGEVGALDEHVPEVLREERLLEVRRVVRPRRQQHDARVVSGRRERRERAPLLLKIRREPLDVTLAELVGQQARHDDAVLERVARARRRLRAIGQHTPRARALPHEVRRVYVKEAPARGLHAAARPQEARVREHELGRQVALVEQPLRPVDVGEDRVEEARPLREPRRQLCEVVRSDDDRHGAERPRTLHALGVAVGVEAHAVVVNEVTRLLPTSPELVGRERVEARRERPPRRADLVVFVGQLVERRGVGRVGLHGPRRRRAVRRRVRIFGYWQARAGHRGRRRFRPPASPTGKRR